MKMSRTVPRHALRCDEGGSSSNNNKQRVNLWAM